MCMVSSLACNWYLRSRSRHLRRWSPNILTNILVFCCSKEKRTSAFENPEKIVNFQRTVLSDQWAYSDGNTCVGTDLASTLRKTEKIFSGHKSKNIFSRDKKYFQIFQKFKKFQNLENLQKSKNLKISQNLKKIWIFEIFEIFDFSKNCGISKRCGL